MKTTRWIPILWVGLLMGGLPLVTTVSVHAEEDPELFPLLEELDSLPSLEEDLPLLSANDTSAEEAAPVTQAPVFVAQQPITSAETAAIPEPPMEISTPAQPPVEIPVVEVNSEPTTVAEDLLTPPVASSQAPLTEEKTMTFPAKIITKTLPAGQETPTAILPPVATVPQVTTPNATPQSVVVPQTETPASAGTVVTETVVPPTTAVPCQECYEYVPVYPRRTPVVRYGMPLPMGRGYGLPSQGFGRPERGIRRLLPDTGYTLRGPRDFDEPNPRPIGP